MNTLIKTRSLTFKVIRPDWDDISEFEITAMSNNWQASLKFWGEASTFKDFGNQLVSFGANLKQSVQFELGSENLSDRWAYYVLLRAYCYDAVGHAAVEVALNNRTKNPDLQMVRFNILSEIEQINELGRLLSVWDPTTQNELVWEAKVS